MGRTSRGPLDSRSARGRSGTSRTSRATGTSRRGRPSYVALLKRADKALKAADPGAKTVLAGLPNESWKALKAIYDAGARGSFDVVALHPYTGIPENVVRIVKIVRREMARRGDAQGARVDHGAVLAGGEGQDRPSTAASRRPRRARRDRLKEGLPLLADERRTLLIGRVYWYTWLSVEGITDSAFDYSGLRRMRDGQLHDAPALAIVHPPGPPLAGLREAARATPCAAADARTLRAPCGGETVTGLSWRNGRSGACCSRRWRAASAFLDAAARLRPLRSPGSAATAGALVAAFLVASALAPVRGRIVDRRGPRALVAFALRLRRRRPGRSCWRSAGRAGRRGGRAGRARRARRPAARARSRARRWGARCASAASACSAPTRSTRRARSRR